MKYRKKIDLVADILTVVIKDTKKTRIMYAGNLSFNLLNSYLETLTNSNLISFNSKNKTYSITEAGKKFLNLYNEYNQNKQTSKMVFELLERKKENLKKMFFQKKAPQLITPPTK